ncbi:MAG: prepilin-type N-terminal cleavage/methylation domain-containing protein [Alteromonadales bacterium]|nr:prepilin-type N-terminal cleavage/methylation domain-containing protein [Alteromonadales bacterium]
MGYSALHKNKLNNQQGFTLVEVLIALVLSSIALLGLAAAQLKSLQYATNSFNYTVSLIQANNAVERTWENLCDLQDGNVLYDADYDTANFDSPIATYTVAVVPAATQVAPAASPFNNNLMVTVSWNDARMDDDNASVIRINAQYPQVCG